MTNQRHKNGSAPFRVSEAANLALHALTVMAVAPGEMLSTRQIATRLKASVAHLAKVMVALEHAGLVAGTRGPAGGYRLTRPAASVTLKEIYEAIEGPLSVPGCLFGKPVCQAKNCMLSDYFGGLNREVAQKLARTRLTDLVQAFGGRNGKQA